MAGVAIGAGVVIIFMQYVSRMGWVLAFLRRLCLHLRFVRMYGCQFCIRGCS